MSKTLATMQHEAGERERQQVSLNESGVEKQIRQYTERQEKERLAKRKAIREQIAERARLMAEVEQVTDQLKTLDSRADEAASKHAEATEPIQEKLAAASGAARAKLLSQLADCNLELEDRLHAIDRCRQPLLKSKADLQIAFASLKTEQFLTQAGVGRPATLAEAFSAKKRLEHALARVGTAESRLRELEAALAIEKTTKSVTSSFGWARVGAKPEYDLPLIFNLTRAIGEWTCELTHASQERHEAKSAIGEVMAELLDE